MREPFFGDVLQWLVEQRRPDAPAQVSFCTYDLHHNGSYWVQVVQQQRYGAAARVHAEATSDRLRIDTENVQHLAVDPPAVISGAGDLLVDGQAIRRANAHAIVGLRREQDGGWQLTDPDPPPGEKGPQLCGPFGGLFERGTVLVRGTTGSDEETFYQEWCSRDAAKFFKDSNGGVHRGGIPGLCWVDLPIVDDRKWLAAESKDGFDDRNVMAYGTPRTNAVLGKLADELNVYAETGEIRVGDRTFSGEGLGLIAVTPFPDGSGRYLGIHGGTSPDAITSGAHLNLQLLPDYLVYNASRVLEWGFFDSDWRPVPGGDA
jgi:hypothetical protein